MNEKAKCSCCSNKETAPKSSIAGEYVCYCNKVTEQDIISAMKEKGALTVEAVIKITGAMTNSNCKVTILHAAVLLS